MSDTLRTDVEAPAGYRLGDPIALHDLLALPPDGRRYTRDAAGRLALMAPDDARAHRFPLTLLLAWLTRALDPRRHIVVPEPGVAFDVVYDLRGRALPPSRLGPKQLDPDVAVFADRPGYRGEGDRAFAPDGLALVAEVLCPGTWRNDLGRGQADEVDRWRSFLESGVPEYWILNPAPEARGPLPGRSALFLRNTGQAWAALEGEGVVAAPGDPRPITAGAIRSAAIPGLVFDLGAFWADLDADCG